MSTPLIELTDVNFAYGANKVLANIHLEIQKGEYVGIIGPNGGGKTTLLQVMLGLLHPNHGTVRLFGESIGQFKQWHRIGYVAQHMNVEANRPPMTVAEVVALGRVGRRGLLRLLSRHDARAVEAAMREVDVFTLRHRLITELSGGQRQRAFIAKALAAEPEVLLLDEPTVGIDIASQDKFYQLLAKLHAKKGITLILVSHDVDVVVGEVTKVACINRTLAYDGAPSEFVNGGYMTRVYGKQRKFVLHGH